MNTDKDIGSFLNDKSEIINEILQSVRSINDNGFSNGVIHLKKSLELLEQFKNKHDYFDKLLSEVENK